jgi:hypothetical protein
MLDVGGDRPQATSRAEVEGQRRAENDYQPLPGPGRGGESCARGSCSARRAHDRIEKGRVVWKARIGSGTGGVSVVSCFGEGQQALSLQLIPVSGSKGGPLAADGGTRERERRPHLALLFCLESMSRPWHCQTSCLTSAMGAPAIRVGDGKSQVRPSQRRKPFDTH